MTLSVRRFVIGLAAASASAAVWQRTGDPALTAAAGPLLATSLSAVRL